MNRLVRTALLRFVVCTLLVGPSLSAQGTAAAAGLTFPHDLPVNGCQASDAWTPTAVGRALVVPEPGTHAGLLDLTLSSGAPEPSFAGGTLSDSASVANSVTAAAVGDVLPPSCTYVLSPLDVANHAAAGGTVDVTVTTPAGCPVTATSYQAWLTIGTITPSGATTTVPLQISANAGAARATAIRVADRLFLVTQRTAPGPTVAFAIIGDYGTGDANEAAVASLVASWGPAFVIAAGDDYYGSAGGTGTARYDESTGRYYCSWLKDISTTGSRCPVGPATVNAFFPALGNHDYGDAAPGPDTYLAYFTLPGSGFSNTSGNERYYDFVNGPVHFFVLNSNSQEANGTTSGSLQGQWLQAGLAASTARWKVVVAHHPPYSSDSTHGSNASMQWPFAAWGADIVVSGHSHTYERVVRDGIVYFVNGLGGAGRYAFGAPVTGSASRYNANWGAQKVAVNNTTLDLEFFDVTGALVDSSHLEKP